MKKKMTMLALTLTAALALTACGNQSASAAQASAAAPTAAPTAAPAATPATAQTAVAGTVLLSVNPEIEMDYDDGGRVLALRSCNADGQAVLDGYEGYAGRPCSEVAGELVGRINAGGYFDETIAGQEKNIVLKLEQGSAQPDDTFLTEMEQAIRTTVERDGIGSRTVALDADDWDDAHEAEGYINAEAAQQLLATQLGRSDLQFVERDYDLDDGDYEIAFVLDGVEYEYEVDARSGKVLEMEADAADGFDDDRDDLGENRSDDWDDDHDDVWDDADDRYDDLDDAWDDADDRYDDLDDAWDDADDRYDDLDDDWDDADDRYDDLDDAWDDQDDWDDDQDDDWDDDWDDAGDDDWDDQDDDDDWDD